MDVPFRLIIGSLKMTTAQQGKVLRHLIGLRNKQITSTGEKVIQDSKHFKLNENLKMYTIFRVIYFSLNYFAAVSLFRSRRLSRAAAVI